jgi:hypothetical protein
MEKMTKFEKRLFDVVKDFGWGPNNEVPQFYRNESGWKLGNGTVVTPWGHKKNHPTCKNKAIKDIEYECNIIRTHAGMPLFPLE